MENSRKQKPKIDMENEPVIGMLKAAGLSLGIMIPAVSLYSLVALTIMTNLGHI